MSGMGRHNLLNGHRGEDGAVASPAIPPTLAPFAISQALQVQRLVPALPPRTEPATVPQQDIATVAVTPQRVRFDGDKLRRSSMWLLASGVAAIAAIVSYSHIYDLGRAHGGSGVAARLLPLSVDMLILVGELMLLHEADAKGRRFILGWVLVWSGVLATLASNVTYGAQYGIAGALIWGWPAYSFILAASGMVAVVKRCAARDDDRSAADKEPDIEPHADADKTADIPMDRQPDIQTVVDTDKPQVTRARKTVTGADKAAGIIRRNPSLTNAEVAKRAGVSEKTAQRARAAAAKGQDPEE